MPVDPTLLDDLQKRGLIAQMTGDQQLKEFLQSPAPSMRASTQLPTAST